MVQVRLPTPSTPSSGVAVRPVAADFWTRLVRLAVLGTIGTSFVVFAMQVVQGIFLARILGPQARGEYGTAVFYTQTLTYVGLLGTLFAVARRAAQERTLGNLRRAAVRVGVLTGLGTMGLVTILSLAALPTEKAYLAPLCVACSLMLPWEHMRLTLLAIDHGSGAFARYNTNQLVGAAAFPALLLLLWLSGSHSRTIATLFLVLVPLLGLAFRLATDREPLLFGPVAPPPRTLIREGFPYLCSVVASDLFARLDMFLILWLASFTVQGYYAAAVPAASLLIVAPNALALFAFNAGAATGCPRTLRSVLAAAAGVAGFQTVAALAFAAVLPTLIMLVYGQEFLGAVPLAWALLPAYAFNGCTVVADSYLRGRGKAGIGVWSRLTAAGVMGLATALLYNRWHELSVPLAASAGHAINFLWILLAVVLDVHNRSHQTAYPEKGLVAET